MKIYYLSAWTEINYWPSYTCQIGEMGVVKRGSIATVIGD